MKDARPTSMNIRDRLDQLCDENASSVLDDIGGFQRQHVAHVGRLYGRFISQVELVFSLLVEIVDGINYMDKSGWPKYRSLQFVLMVHNLKSIESALDRMVKGSYEDAINLIRGPYEALLRIVFISCFPADPYAGLGKAPKGTRQFQATNFVEQDLRLDWTDYDLMSAFSHANSFSALSHVIALAQGREKGPVALKYQFDNQRFEIGANLLNVVLLAFLRLVTEVFTASSPPQPALATRLERARELVGLVTASFGMHPRPYMRNLVEDLEDITRLIRWADAGGSWREGWAKIRLVRVLSRRAAQLSVTGTV